MYGKLQNGIMTPAPRKIYLDDWVILNPTPEQYLEAGYLKVVYTEPPEIPEGFEAIPEWEEQDGQIVQVWRLEEIQNEEE